MQSILLKSDTLNTLTKIGLDPNNQSEMNLLKFAEVHGLDQLKKFGCIPNPSAIGLNISNQTHKAFLDELKKAHDIAEMPEAAEAYSCPGLQPTPFTR